MNTTTIVAPNGNEYQAVTSSWYEVVYKPSEFYSIQNMSPEEFTLPDGRKRYKVSLPCLLDPSNKNGEQALLDLDKVCRFHNISDDYKTFEYYQENQLTEHPRNKTETEKYSLPPGGYYIGDPHYVLDESYDDFPCDQEKPFYKYEGEWVISVVTMGDGEFPFYNLNRYGTARDENGNRVRAGKPVLEDIVPVHTGVIAFINLDIIGIDLEEAYEGEPAEHGIVVDWESDNEGEALDVEIRYMYQYGYKAVASIKFLDHEILIDDTEMYEDEDEE